MADDQHLVHILGQRVRDPIRESAHPLFLGRRVCPPVAGREGIVMHQVPAKPGVAALEPAKHGPCHKGPQPDPCPGSLNEIGRKAEIRGSDDHAAGPDKREKGHEPDQHGQSRLGQQQDNRIERRDHRAFPQPHQAEKRARADIGPCRAQKLPIGRGDPVAHAVLDDIGPDQNLDIRLRCLPVDDRVHRPAVIALGPLRPHRQLIARNPGLLAAATAIAFTVFARRNRVEARNVKNPPGPDLLALCLTHNSTLHRLSGAAYREILARLRRVSPIRQAWERFRGSRRTAW